LIKSSTLATLSAQESECDWYWIACSFRSMIYERKEKLLVVSNLASLKEIQTCDNFNDWKLLSGYCAAVCYRMEGGIDQILKCNHWNQSTSCRALQGRFSIKFSLWNPTFDPVLMTLLTTLNKVDFTWISLSVPKWKPKLLPTINEKQKPNEHFFFIGVLHIVITITL